MGFISIIFSLIILVISLVSVISYMQKYNVRKNQHQQIMNSLQPVRSMTTQEMENYRPFYRRKLNSEIPLSVYELKGPLELQGLRVNHVDQYTFSAGGILIDQSSSSRIMQKTGMPMVEDFKDYVAAFGERLRQLVDQYGETIPQDEIGKMEENYNHLVPKIEVCFPKGMGKPAVLVTYRDWNLGTNPD